MMFGFTHTELTLPTFGSPTIPVFSAMHVVLRLHHIGDTSSVQFVPSATTMHKCFSCLHRHYLKLRNCPLLKNFCSRVCHRMLPDAAGVDCDRNSEAPVCIAAVGGRLCIPCRCLTAPQLLHVLLTYIWSCIDLCILLETLSWRRFTG
jgi:hypothetical protein